MRFERTLKIALLVLFVLPLAGYAAGEQQPGEMARQSWVPSDIALPAQASEHPFQVGYMLDQDGRPYIISVFAEDPTTIRLILQKIGEQSGAQVNAAGQLAISFYYDNIR